MESIGSEISNVKKSTISEDQPVPLLRVIRMKCLDCCCQQITEVRECRVTTCSLWPYRMGRNPFRKKLTRQVWNFQKKTQVPS